ncbi:transmembrane 9 superfamily member 8-like protein [Tanacetum coccineum]
MNGAQQYGSCHEYVFGNDCRLSCFDKAQPLYLEAITILEKSYEREEIRLLMRLTHLAVAARGMVSHVKRSSTCDYGIFRTNFSGDNQMCHLNKIVDSAENLAELLLVQMRVPKMCNVVCHIVLTEKTTKEFKEKIDDEYRINMILDNLPLVVRLFP